ncbi:hypothetical protein LX36DRAFT_320742 [Colletotrichum falcatum]|nr:hypothetical protein LX36DRAFT_320742 [Colletotrichum falcatum]
MMILQAKRASERLRGFESGVETIGLSKRIRLVGPKLAGREAGDEKMERRTKGRKKQSRRACGGREELRLSRSLICRTKLQTGPRRAGERAPWRLTARKQKKSLLSVPPGPGGLGVADFGGGQGET